MTQRLLTFLSLSFATFSVLTAAISPRPCHAQTFPPLAPEDLKMTNEPKAPGAAAIILFREVDRDDRASTETSYYRLKIFTPEGRKYANIEVPFFKSGDLPGVIDIKARTIKPDGSEVPFDGTVFEKLLVKSRRGGIAAKTFTLPSVEPGCIIEYSYTVFTTRSFTSHWILSESLFTRNARFILFPFTASYYSSTPLTLHESWQHLPPGIQPTTSASGVVSMDVNDIPAFQTEDFMPPENELKARVDFIYRTGKPQNDPALFWKDIGKLRNEQLERFIGKRKAMEEAVGQIVSLSDPSELKLRKLYQRVQQVRNTSFQLRKTAQEEKRSKEKNDENVEDVWKRGYGNHEQLDWLFVALVRAAGFEAYGCLVASRAEYFFTPKTEQSGQLDEPVVLVKLDGKDLYFNPGAAFAPFGMLNWSETATAGLRLDKDGGTWIQTPLPNSSDSRIEHIAKMQLTDEGNLEGTLKVIYTGLEAMYHRQDMRNADDVTRKKFLEDRVKHQVPMTSEVELTNQPDWESSESPLVAEFRLNITGWASGAGKHSTMPAGVFTAIEKHVFERENRLHPIYIDYPYEKEDDVTIELPAGWKVESVPPPQSNDGHVVTYSVRVENTQGPLHLTRKLRWNFLLLDQKYYTALRNFFQTVRTNDDQQILLQPSATAAAN